MKIEINKAINKAISKSKKLKLWEHMYQMEKEIEELKEKIAELKKESKPNWFIPEEDEDFYYVDTYGDVNWNNANGYSDNILKHNQVFKTREEANNHLKVMKAEVSINKRIAELNEGWKPDWENTIQKKYYIFYDNFREILDYNRSSAQFQPNALQLKDKKVARQIIDELEEELKLYLRY